MPDGKKSATAGSKAGTSAAAKAGESEAAGGKAGKGAAAGEKVSGSATLTLTFQSPSSAKAAYGALLAEADFSHRGGSRVRLDGNSVRVEISADDPVSLRASLNSYLRLMQIIKTVEQDTE